MERKFNNDSDFSQQYHDFMREYEDLRHMSPIIAPSETSQGHACYLPHDGMLKLTSTITKLRVVFNGSQRSVTGDSLNGRLLPGLNLLPSLPDILLSWRRHRFVLAADIEKMYRQILVDPEDRDVQRILWRDTQRDPVREYKLNTVTYGLTCAPFLAVRTLRQLAHDERTSYPLGTEAILHDTYVDDVLTGASSLAEATYIRDELIEICKAGGFTLRKWTANNLTLLHDVPDEHRASHDSHTWQSEQCHGTLAFNGTQQRNASVSWCRPRTVALPS